MTRRGRRPVTGRQPVIAFNVSPGCSERTTAGAARYRLPRLLDDLWFDRSGRTLIAGAATEYHAVRLSPDGQTVAVARSATDQAPDMWLLDVDEG